MINKSEILARFASNQVTEEERLAFAEWLKTLSPAEMEALMDEYGEMLVHINASPEPANTALLEAIHQEIAVQDQPVVRRMTMPKWWQAAAVVLLLGSGAYFWKTQQQKSPVVIQQTNIVPGGHGAILTLADGSKITLDSAQGGLTGTNASVAGNTLIYDNSGKENVYNTINTPNGRQFQLILPDGTKVWLNAASALRYPIAFTGEERRVYVTGEAYFEVAHNAEMAFRVDVNGKAEVEVLGTNFNVHAYNNESTIKATLLEGAVRINKKVILKPGQQAQISAGIMVINTDVEKAIAWKKGLFNFDDVPLEEVMRQLERWYDIHIVYENGVPDIRLAGKMTKQVTLDGLLTVLKELGVHCRLDGRTLTVLP